MGFHLRGLSDLDPGDRVMVGGDISATVERVIFARYMTRPLFLVEWWDSGDLKTKELHQNDVRIPEPGEWKG